MGRKSHNKKRIGRDVSIIASYSLPRSIVSRLSPSLIDIEDRRTFHPERDFRPARSFSKANHRLVLADKVSRTNADRFGRLRAFPSQTKAIVAFDAPKKVLVCVRRQRRKEVLHALKKTGKVGQRRPRRNWLSSISCRGAR